MKEIENELYLDGYTFIAGVDEAGRGPLAGPVCAAAVILPKDAVVEGVNDSKKLSAKKRDMLFDKIKNVIDEENRYGQMTMLSKKIRGMDKVNYDPKRDVSSLYDRDE